MKNSIKSERIQKLDVKGVFYSKNPSVARLIPGFVYSYLRRIIHEDDMNTFLDKHGEKLDKEFLEAVIEDFNVTITTEGEEYLNKNDKYIIASNHPLGGFDGIMLLMTIAKHYEEFYFLVNDILMNIKNIQHFFIPINKHGKQGSKAVEMMNEAFESNAQILTFPSGYVSRKIKGQIMDLPWQKNFIMKSIQFQRDIVPVHISGNNTNFFYRLANLRKFFGIKTNIEMLYLADETYKHRNKSITIKFGKPIPWQTFDKSKKPIEWAKWVKEKAYALDNVFDIPL